MIPVQPVRLVGDGVDPTPNTADKESRVPGLAVGGARVKTPHIPTELARSRMYGGFALVYLLLNL